jgi:hypothetical protein
VVAAEDARFTQHDGFDWETEGVPSLPIVGETPAIA